MLGKSLISCRILNFAIFYFVTIHDIRLSTHKQREAANLRRAFAPTQTAKRVAGRVLTDKCYKKGTYR